MVCKCAGKKRVQEPTLEANHPENVLGETTTWDNGVLVQKYELNNAERSYVLPENVVSAGEILDFWGGVDKDGEGPEKYAPHITQFIKEAFALGITGLYAAGNAMTIFTNRTGGQLEKSWEDIEPQIRVLIDSYLLADHSKL